MEKKTCNAGDWRTSVCLAGVPSPHCLVRAWCYCFRSELSSSSHEAPPPTYCWATGEGRLLHVAVKLPKKVVTARQSLVATILLPPYLSLFWSDRRLEHCPAKERYCCQRSCLRKWPEIGSWLKFGVAASLMCRLEALLPKPTTLYFAVPWRFTLLSCLADVLPCRFEANEVPSPPSSIASTCCPPCRCLLATASCCRSITVWGESLPCYHEVPYAHHCYLPERCCLSAFPRHSCCKGLALPKLAEPLLRTCNILESCRTPSEPEPCSTKLKLCLEEEICCRPRSRFAVLGEHRDVIIFILILVGGPYYL